MRILALLAVLVAACGGGKPRPAEAPVEPPEPPIPQAPAGTDRAVIEKETQLLEDLADRTCACKDLACVQAVDEERVAYARTATMNDSITGLETWPADLDARGRRASFRTWLCAEEYGYTSRANGTAALRRATDLRERACACDDIACARQVRARMAEFVEDNRTTHLDDSMRVVFTEETEQARRCIEASFPDLAHEALPAEPAHRAPPPPVAQPSVASPAAHLVAIQTLARKGCACADRTCLAGVDRELADLVRSIELVARQALHPAQVKESFLALEKLSVCMTDQKLASPEFGRAIAPRYAELVDLQCACHDKACRTELARALPEAIAAFYFPIEDPEWEAYADVTQRYETCTAATPETDQARAVRELTALRDTACACEDAACAEKVQTGFDAFLENHKDTKGSKTVVETIGTLAGEMRACLDAARNE